MSDATQPFPTSATRIEAVVDAIDAQLETADRHFLKARDLDCEGASAITGSILASLAEHPQAVEDVYEVEIPVEVERHSWDGSATIWEVRRR